MGLVHVSSFCSHAENRAPHLRQKRLDFWLYAMKKARLWTERSREYPIVQPCLTGQQANGLIKYDGGVPNGGLSNAIFQKPHPFSILPGRCPNPACQRPSQVETRQLALPAMGGPYVELGARVRNTIIPCRSCTEYTCHLWNHDILVSEVHG